MNYKYPSNIYTSIGFVQWSLVNVINLNFAEDFSADQIRGFADIPVFYALDQGSANHSP